MTEKESVALYRQFGEDGRLLYVGVSVSAMERFRAHLDESEWAQGVRTITVEWFDTRRSAEQAERKAIRDEAPIHNTVRYAKTITKSVLFTPELWKKAQKIGDGCAAEGIRRALEK